GRRGRAVGREEWRGVVWGSRRRGGSGLVGAGGRRRGDEGESGRRAPARIRAVGGGGHGGNTGG
ncbi:hypothetical protein DN069_15335, partial [Streptacidiphilus pinicola]